MQLIRRNLYTLMSNEDKASYKQMIDRVSTDDETFIAFMSRIVVNTLVSRLIASSRGNIQRIINEYQVDKENASEFFLNHPDFESKFSSAIGYVSISESKSEKDEINNYLSNFKSVMSEKILTTYDVQRIDSKGKYIIRKLFESYFSNPQQLPDSAIELYLIDVNEYKSAKSIQQTKTKYGAGVIRSKFIQYHQKHIEDADAQIKLMRIICDYIAGMTDAFAISEYEKLYG